MKKVIITHYSEEDNIEVNCPHCEHWEQQPTDQQRHHLQSFDILDWLEEENDVEQSHMKCHVCKEEFVLSWDYENLINKVGNLLSKIESDMNTLYEMIHETIPENFTIDLDSCDCVSTTYPDHYIGGIKDSNILFYHIENSTEYLEKTSTVNIDDLTWVLNVIQNNKQNG